MLKATRLSGVLALTALALTGLACAKRAAWEYKVVDVMRDQPNSNRTGAGSGTYTSVTPKDQVLDELGKEGWELTTSYLELETAWTNFGNSDYVTGLQPNVRPQRLVLIFKRPVQSSLTGKVAGKPA